MSGTHIVLQRQDYTSSLLYMLNTDTRVMENSTSHFYLSVYPSEYNRMGGGFIFLEIRSLVTVVVRN